MRRAGGFPAAAAVLALSLSPSLSPADAPRERTFLADLTPASEEALRGAAAESPLPAEGRALLDRILDAAPTYSFDAGLVQAETDVRWFAVTPAEGEGRAILELRRWPGDTVLAVYALAGEAPPADGVSVRLRGAGVPVRADGIAGRWRWDGLVETEAGPRPASWLERRTEGAPGRIGALVLPGDAGLGDAAISDLAEEAAAVFDNLDVREAAWRVVPLLPAGGEVVPPEGPLVPGAGDERKQPWQVVDGPAFTLGLPPGIRARRLDRGVEAPRPVPGALLWLRGRYRDRDGATVAVGDGRRAGYVAEIRPPEAEWLEGASPPRGAPSATVAVAAAFLEATTWTDARSARAERWSEPGFEGAWLVFRLAFADFGVEIGLPVLEGRQSPSLFWIPLTWRGPGRPPAPPPIDPATRFGIRFDHLGKLDQKSRPWTSGFLSAPGFRLEVPKGWTPNATLRSEDGYPILVLAESGDLVARVVRLEKGDPRLTPAESEGWTPRRRPGSQRAAAAYVKTNGTAVFVAPEGHGFLLEPDPDAKIDADVWERMLGSVSLTPAGGSPTGAK